MSDLATQMELHQNLKLLKDVGEDLKDFNKELTIKSKYTKLSMGDVLTLVRKQQNMIVLFQERFTLEAKNDKK